MRYGSLFLIALALAFTPLARAQDTATVVTDSSVLFASDEVLEFRLATNIRALLKDRGTKRPYHAATVDYQGPDGNAVSIPLKVRTRGIYRLKNCAFPPIRMNFGKGKTAGTVFAGEDKPKLTTHCQDNELYEQNLLQEYLLYKAYNLLTPIGHRVRLARVTYVDGEGDGGKPIARRYGILIEDPERMAARHNGGKIIEAKGAVKDDLDPYHTAMVGVFEYFAANTDYSIPGLHNIELIQNMDAVYPIAYDFDWSGAIATPYAKPDPKLPIKDVKTRLYRGYCPASEHFTKVFAAFNEKKDAIYALYTDLKPLDRDHVKRAHRYFDEFYRVINDPKKVRSDIMEYCRG